MPAYIETPLDGIPPMLLPGIPGYFFGSLASGPTVRMLVKSVAITTDVATVGVQMVEGNIPAVGSLISIRGTQTASGDFNVTNATLTEVSINAETGAGTVQFALSHGDIATTPDAGEAAVPVPEVAEAMTDKTSLQLTMQVAAGLPNNSRDLIWEIYTPSAPSSFSAALQVATLDEDAEYTTIDTATATGSRQVAGVRGTFLRVVLSAVDGGSSPTVIAKVTV
jgi:hypothetical protein